MGNLLLLHDRLELLRKYLGFTVETSLQDDYVEVRWFDERHEECCGGGTCSGVVVYFSAPDGKGFTREFSEVAFASIGDVVKDLKSGIQETDDRDQCDQ